MARNISCVFFSRGRGHGHAIPDMAITDELPQFIQNIEVNFASYATGAETFRARNRAVVDMRLPEDNSFFPTLFAAHNVILDLRPDVVLAHEEFAAIIAAKITGIPAIFVSAWLPPAASIGAASLAYADSIVLLERPGIFPTLESPETRLRFAGPLVRKMNYTRKDCAKARSDLSIPKEAQVVLVANGGWASEAKAPTAAIILAAFGQMKHTGKLLLWLSGREHEALSSMTSGMSNVRLIKQTDQMDVFLAASDIVITKANRGTVMEAANMGLPTISLSYGLNPIDDILVTRLRSNLQLHARATDGSTLCHYIEQILSSPELRNPAPLGLERSTEDAARIIAEEIIRVTPFAKNNGVASLSVTS
jgi:hypothetical protein